MTRTRTHAAWRTALCSVGALLTLTLAANEAFADRGRGGHWGRSWGGPSRGHFYYNPGVRWFGSPWPAFQSVLVIGGISYLVANGVYYREQAEGGYIEVPPPVGATQSGAPIDRSYVYPRQAQTAEQQASDEYECHRWAIGQSGFDPSNAATGTGPNAVPAQRSDYLRARTACLEGRGYTVR